MLVFPDYQMYSTLLGREYAEADRFPVVREAHIRAVRLLFRCRVASAQCLSCSFQLYKGAKSFEYLVVPVDPDSTTPVRVLTLQVPPHVVYCTTLGKMAREYGSMTHTTWHSHKDSLIERVEAAMQPESGHGLTIYMLSHMQRVHLKEPWWPSHPPPPKHCGQTKAPETTALKRKSANMERDADALGSRHKPKRRRLQADEDDDEDQDDDDDDDDSVASDTHVDLIGGDGKELTVLDREWLESIQWWAAGTSGADTTDETLLNDGQIPAEEEGWLALEHTRKIEDLDLNTPDFFERFEGVAV